MSDLCALFDRSPERPKGVTFSPYVQVYSDVPWPHRPPPVCPRPFPEDDVHGPAQGSSKDTVYYLRVEIKGDEPASVFGVILLIVCLRVLFLLSGFIVHRILLLEVDAEIGKQANPQRFG
jgi:hypothetical protein